MMTSREELDSFLCLIKNPEWETFLELKKRHHAVLQKEVNRCIKENQFNEAIRAQAKLEENHKDIELLRKRMDELKKALPQEEEFTNG